MWAERLDYGLELVLWIGHLQYLVNWTCTRPYFKSIPQPFAIAVRYCQWYSGGLAGGGACSVLVLLRA